MMLGWWCESKSPAAAKDSGGPRLVFIGALYVGVLFPYFALLRNSPGGI